MKRSSFRTTFFTLIVAATALAQAPPDGPAARDSTRGPAEQEVAPLSTPRPTTRERVAYLRFWNLCTSSEKAYDLVASEGDDSGLTLYDSVEKLKAMPGYRVVPSGRYNFAIHEAGKRDRSLKEFDILLRDGAFVTFFVSDRGGKVELEMMDDTFDETETPAGNLRVFHCLPGVKTSVRIGHRSYGLSPGRRRIIQPLPLEVVPFEIIARLENGRISGAVGEIDFTACQRADLLIVKDGYDRFRPRVAYSGKLLDD